MILGAIIAAEVAFWVFLVGGLAVRYVLRAPRAGAALLIATPLIDLVLLILTYIDLSSGRDSTFVHGLSALYIGFSLVFGPSAVRAMDAKFAHRYQRASAAETSPTKAVRTDPADSSGPVSAPQRAPHSDRDSLESQQRSWLRCCLASGISAALLGAGIAVVGFAGSFWLLYWIVVVVSVVIVWWIIGPGLTRWRSRRAAKPADSAARRDAAGRATRADGPDHAIRWGGNDRAPY